MKVAVMGAGAVGCYYGGMLARAGHEVVLIARATHVEAITRSGLLLETLSFTEHVPLTASQDAAAIAGAELVLCCIKSGDSESAASAMAPHLAPGAMVLSLQNGVDNAARLSACLGREVAPVVVYVATEMAGPGHAKHNGRGELVLGPHAAASLKPILEAAGVPVQVSDNVLGALWAKLILNCAFNALSAISRQPYGRLWQAPGVQATMRDAVAECHAVAAASGITIPGDSWAAVEAIASSMPAQYSSTAQDLMRGKRSEIDHLNGYVLRQGEALGIPTPTNRVLHTLVRLLEDSLEAA